MKHFRILCFSLLMLIGFSKGISCPLPPGAAIDLSITSSNGNLLCNGSNTVLNTNLNFEAYYGTVEEILAYSPGHYGPNGGKVIYDKGTEENGWRYLQLSPFDITIPESILAGFGCDCQFVNANGDAAGAGFDNFNAWLSSPCASELLNYIDTLHILGFDDWYIPSPEELLIAINSPSFIFENENIFLGLSPDNYWTSLSASFGACENNGGVYQLSLPSGTLNSVSRNNTQGKIRLVRRFSNSPKYTWSNGATGESLNITNLLPGNYLYQVNTTFFIPAERYYGSCIYNQFAFPGYLFDSYAKNVNDTEEILITVFDSQTYTDTIDVSACSSYTWKGNTYSQSGTYTWSGTNAAGCDSVVTLNLTILPPPPLPDCIFNYSFDTATCSWVGSGGPPIPPRPADLTNASACGSYTWSVNGQTYTSSGNYTFIENCAYFVLNLTINQATASTVNASITEGESYNFNSQNLTTAGTYTATLQNAAGCDSVVTLNLTVNAAPQICDVTVSDNEICAGESVSISVGGFTPSPGGCSSANMPANLQQGLVAWYPFCGNAEDESSNNYNGTVRNAVLTTDRFGHENQAYSFTTGQDIIVNGTQSLNLYPMSISLWYNVDTIASIYDEANIFSKYSPAAWNGYAIITSNMAPEENNVYYPTVKPWYTRNINNRVIGRYGSAPFEHENIDLDAWHHMVFTLNQNGGNCYVNGTLVATDTWDGTAGPSSSSFIWKIGGLYDYWYNGKIDDIAVYNRVLTPAEATQLYQYQAQSETTSILWSNGEATPTINVSPSETTTYSVTVTQGTQTCTSDVTITVNQPTTSTVNATITQGESYSFNGQNLTTAGTYFDTLQNEAGCDLYVTLNLTVNPVTSDGCYATSVVDFSQGQRADATNVIAIRSNATQALGMPEPVVTNVVNFVSLGFGGSITLAFEAPIANGVGNDVRIDEATWGNNTCNNYPEKADVFASQDGTNFIYLGKACHDASFDLGVMSWAKYIRVVDVSNALSFTSDADGFDVNGIECLNGAATSLNDDGLVACTLQEIVNYAPNNRKNGTAVPAPRNNANNALGAPQSNNTINFTALGFGGYLIAKFDYVVFNQQGNDLRVTETSFGNPSCNNYPEKAQVSVSLDNVTWTELGEICQDGEFDLGSVNYAQYIKIQDVSPINSNKFNGAADGYDVDAVVVLNNGCGTSSARISQLDNTTTPDAAMTISAFPNPMEDYTIVNFDELEIETDFNFQIMDAAGRLIRNENIRVSPENPTYLFTATELARGIYQLVISNKNDNQVIRLVK